MNNDELYFSLTFNHGGVQDQLPGFTKAKKRDLARRLRPTSNYTGRVECKSAANGDFYRLTESSNLLGVFKGQSGTWIKVPA
jgi:ribosomal protein S30